MESEKILKIVVKNLVESPYQGRYIPVNIGDEVKSDKSLAELARNIKDQGLMTPIIVRPVAKGRYEIIDGHRRVAACKIIGAEEIDAIVRDYQDKDAQVFSIVGNLLHRNLRTIEMAIALRKIEKSKLFESREKLSEAIGKDKTYIGDLINTLKMDYRIVENLAEYKTTDDVRLLRAIRKAFPAIKLHEEGTEVEDEKWTSDKQWDFYSKAVIEGKLSREDVFDEIKAQVGIKPKEIRFVAKKRKMIISAPYLLDQNLINKIKALIEKGARKED